MEPFEGLFVVLGLLLGLLFVTRRLASRVRTGGRRLAVLETASLSAGHSLALVRVADRCLLVGTSGGQINKLAEFPAADLPTPSPVERRPASAWFRRPRLRETRAVGSPQ